MSAESIPTPAAQPSYAALSLSTLREHPANARKTFDKAALAELKESIKAKGVITPLLVRPLGEGAEYEIVAGHRRFRAAKSAGLEAVPAIIRELDDNATLEVMLIDNLQRADLHPLEEAEGYEELQKLNGYSVDDLAAKVGKSRAYVYGRMKLTALCPEARKAFYEGKLNPSTALLIARIPVAKLQAQATKEITAERFHDGVMSVRDAAAHIQDTYMLRLEQAPWPKADAQLLPAAGACSTCPKRTGNQRELFEDVKNADVCTDPVCFKEKREAWSAKQRAEAEAAGRRVITGKEAKHLVPYEHSSALQGGYIDLNDRCYDDPKSRSYKALVGPAAIDAVLVEDPFTGNLREVMQRSTVTKILRDEGYPWTKKKAASSSSGRSTSYGSPATRQKDKAEALVESRTAGTALRLVVAKAEADKNSGKVLELVLGELAALDVDGVLDRRGVAKKPGRLSVRLKAAGLKEPQLRGILLEAQIVDFGARYPAVVLGAKAAERLGVTGAGGQVWLADRWFTVVGILRPVTLAPEIDRAALVGFPAAEAFLGSNGSPGTVYVQADPDQVEAVREVLPATANPANPNEVRVSRQSDALAARVAANTAFTSLLLGLGAVALLVGGVGIANVMVISVLERRSEIGLRRALGATRGNVGVQFLAESLLLALTGGLAGVVLGAMVTAVYAASRGWSEWSSPPRPSPVACSSRWPSAPSPASAALSAAPGPTDALRTV